MGETRWRRTFSLRALLLTVSLVALAIHFVIFVPRFVELTLAVHHVSQWDQTTERTPSRCEACTVVVRGKIYVIATGVLKKVDSGGWAYAGGRIYRRGYYVCPPGVYVANLDALKRELAAPSQNLLLALFLLFLFLVPKRKK